MLLRKFIPFVVAVAATCTAAESPPLQQPEEYQQRLVDWIRSGKNGYFHPHVQWKRLGGTGPYAMHTTVDLHKGTKLLTVPRSHVLDSFQTHDECTTVARMLGEYQKGEESFFAPYLSYLFDETTGGTTTGLLPGAWSEEGQNLLSDLLGAGEDPDDGLEPRDFGKPDVFESCGKNFRAKLASQEVEDEDERQHAQDAFLFYISRSWTDKMVPVLDMYNHRNGKWLNVESTSAHDLDSDITAYALRHIKAGEQLQNSYSECMDHDCTFGQIKYSYISSSIFNDYGFVEFYPRRWPMNPDIQEELVAEVEEDLETGQKSFQWIFETPSQSTLEWMEAQLERLKVTEQDFRKAVANHRNNSEAGGRHNNIEHEADSLLELFEAYVEVLEMGLKHQADEVGVTYEQFEKDLQEARRLAQFGGEL